MEYPQESSTRDPADQALRESELRFRSTFENAAVGMAHVASDGTWLRVNRRLSEIVGYTPEELLQRTFQDITHPEDLDTDLALLEETLLGQRDNYRIDKRYFHKDGSIVWVSLTVGCVRSPAGEVEYFISVIQDITEQKRVHEALVESEARFRAFQQTSPDGFLIFSSVRDAAGEIIDFKCEFANPSAAKFAQSTVDRMVGHRMLEKTPINREVGLFGVYCRVVESGEMIREQVQITLPDGGLAWFRYTAVKVGDGFAVAFADISRRKNAEADLKQSEARFRAVQQTSPDGFLICRAVRDNEGDIEDFVCVFANPAAHRIAGMEGEDLVGKSMKSHTPPDNRVGMFDLYKHVVETGETAQDEIPFPLRPENRWIRYSVVKVGDGFAVSFSDISDRKAAELALKQSEARFRAIQQTSPDGFLICRAVREKSGAIRDFTIEYVNPAIEGYLGRPADEVIGGTMRQDMPVNFTSGAFERYIHVVESGENWQGEMTFPRPDGQGDGWYWVTAVRVGDGIAVSYGDISDRKAAELALKESETRFRAVQQTSPDGFMVYSSIRDGNGTITDFRTQYVNPAFERMACLPASEVIGRTMRERVPASHFAELFDRYVQVVETATPGRGKSSMSGRSEMPGIARPQRKWETDLRFPSAIYLNQRPLRRYCRSATSACAPSSTMSWRLSGFSRLRASCWKQTIRPLRPPT